MKKFEILEQYHFLAEYQHQPVDYVFNGKNMNNTESILKEMYTSLGFDDYLPYANYDGFVDLLFSGAWEDTNHMSILITDVEVFLSSNIKEDLDLFFRAIEYIAEDWNDNKGESSFELFIEK